MDTESTVTKEKSRSLSGNQERIKDFFEFSKPPQNIEFFEELLMNFISEHENSNRKIVLITSGGTTVPLESRTVRFIDNFSAGTRGSSSAEHFLKNDYAVVFLHRKGSLEPFKRSLPPRDFLEALTVTKDDVVQVKPSYCSFIKKLLYEYEKCKNEKLLLSICFTTLDEYLYLLKLCSQGLSNLGPRVMFYLAAAVSDFYIPNNELPEHKIQSSAGPLNIKLHLVPKMLSPLVSEWASSAFVTSFKLETDPKLLIPKAKKALEKYKHQVVIGNVLDTRKREVYLVTTENVTPIRLKNFDITKGVEIEQYLVEQLIKDHHIFINSNLSNKRDQKKKTEQSHEVDVPAEDISSTS
ncbi:DgyrCDS11340 [Dimorphilus gyrociliatus]|uniref:Phosphopantothenate--cysteine ligase n=1 Tax=Dimorphilus gyrociliatus TaxID=2664684 RepID=A0A7I8W4B6_9ANNE|nr:DgyrCDS11340 [Dimorphilus gyrociliatus]